MFYSNNNDNEFDFSKIFENIANKQKEENNKETMIYNKLLYGNFDGKQVLALDNKTNTIKNILDSNKSNLLSKKVFLANYCTSHEYCDSCIFYQLFNTDCFISSKVLIQDINKYVELYYNTYQKYMKLKNKVNKQELKLINK